MPFVPDRDIDSELDVLENTTIHVCKDPKPTQYSEIAAVELASQAISGSFTKADGDVSGRKTTCPAQTGIAITADGTATSVVLSNGSTQMSARLSTTSQALSSGGTVDIPAFDMEIADPV